MAFKTRAEIFNSGTIIDSPKENDDVAFYANYNEASVMIINSKEFKQLISIVNNKETVIKEIEVDDV